VAIFTPSFLAVLVSAPFFDAFKGSRLFSMAVRGVLSNFVGLLLFVAIKFALSVPWTVAATLLCLAAFILLQRKAHVLWILSVGAALSLFVFR